MLSEETEISGNGVTGTAISKMGMDGRATASGVATTLIVALSQKRGSRSLPLPQGKGISATAADFPLIMTEATAANALATTSGVGRTARKKQKHTEGYLIPRVKRGIPSEEGAENGTREAIGLATIGVSGKASKITKVGSSAC